jgi:hypothetical protein
MSDAENLHEGKTRVENPYLGIERAKGITRLIDFAQRHEKRKYFSVQRRVS